MKTKRIFFLFVLFAILISINNVIAQDKQTCSTGQAVDIDIRHVKECGPIAGYLACKYYGIEATLHELSELCKNNDTGTSLFNLRNALIVKGLYAEGIRITPEMLLNNDEYFLVLPVKEWGEGIDHFDVVMGSKGDKVLLLNYPSKPWFFPIQKLVKYWDGHALAVSNKPINSAYFLPQEKVAKRKNLETIGLFLLSVILGLITVINFRIYRNAKKNSDGISMATK